MAKTELFSRKQSGGVFSVYDESKTTGNIFWVDSGSTTGANATGYGMNPDAPFLTVDYAVGKCTANNGDRIYVMPGHAENLTADSAVDVDVAGVEIIGIGHGADRPTFTATNVAGDFKLAAASVSIRNLLFLGGIDATTGIIEVSGTDCKIHDCEYRDVTGQATDILTTVNNADRLLVDGFKVIGAAAAGGDTAIFLDGCDDAEIRNFKIYGNFALGAIQCRTTASARVHIHDGFIWTENANDLGIKDLITGSTGWIGPNLRIMLQDNAANITTAVTGATFQMAENVYVCNLAGEKVMAIDWTASTNA